MRTQAEKATIFRALHARPGAFIIPNPWEAGTARLLAALGFEALATTSLGLANMLGRSTVSRDEILEMSQERWADAQVGRGGMSHRPRRYGATAFLSSAWTYSMIRSVPRLRTSRDVA